MNVDTFFEYGHYNETNKDKEYYKDLYYKRGFTYVSVRRVKTDTKGLKMYKIVAM